MKTTVRLMLDTVLSKRGSSCGLEPMEALTGERCMVELTNNRENNSIELSLSQEGNVCIMESIPLGIVIRNEEVKKRLCSDFITLYNSIIDWNRMRADV